MTTITVRQLLLALQHVDPTAEVRVAYDSGYAYSDAKSVEVSIEAGKRVVYISTEEADEGYLTDATFHSLVDYIRSFIRELHLTPSEVREAAMLACIIEEERRPFRTDVEIERAMRHDLVIDFAARQQAETTREMLKDRGQHFHSERCYAPGAGDSQVLICEHKDRR